MKVKYYTITIEGKCYDLPKDMPVPERGSVVNVGSLSPSRGIVDTVSYHIDDKGQLFMVNVYTRRD